MSDPVCEAAQAVYDAFVRDEAQGYRSRDRQFAIDVLGKALAAAPVPCAASPADEWQPIENCTVFSKPGEDRKEILVYGPQLGRHIGYCIDYGDGTRHYAAQGFHGDWKITHWMPLPTPPRATGEGARDEVSKVQIDGEDRLRAVGRSDGVVSEVQGDCEDMERIPGVTAAPVAVSLDPHRLREIAERLAKRRAPQFGTCQLCGHRQEMLPTYQTIASSMAAEQWKCQSCGGQLVFMITIGGNEPSQDEDITALLELVARLRGEATVRVEQE